MTIGDYIRGTGVEQRGEYFEKFLQAMGKQNADVVIGPIGTPETAGVAPHQGTQMVVRSQRVADHLNQMMAGTSGPSNPSGTPDTAARTSSQSKPVSPEPKPETPAPGSAPKPGTPSAWRKGSGTSVHSPQPVRNAPAKAPFSEGEEVVIKSYMDAGKTRVEAEALVKDTRGPENKVQWVRPNSPNPDGTTRGPDWKSPGAGKKRP